MRTMDSQNSLTGAPWRAQAERPTVAALDANPIFRDGLASVFGRTDQLDWLGATGAPQDVMRLCERGLPTVVLIDSAVDPAFALSRQLSGLDHGPAVLVIMQDAQLSGLNVQRAWRAGVRGIVPRSIRPRDLVELVGKAAGGERVSAPGIPALAAVRDPAAALSHSMLSRREYQVLQLAAHGMNNHAIAADLHLSVETVRTHIKSIFRKFGAHDRTQVVAMAYRRGLVSASSNSEDFAAVQHA